MNNKQPLTQAEQAAWATVRELSQISASLLALNTNLSETQKLLKRLAGLPINEPVEDPEEPPEPFFIPLP